jgi:hypothetical protein
MNITMFLIQAMPLEIFCHSAVLGNPGLGSVPTGIFHSQFKNCRWASGSLVCFYEQAEQRQVHVSGLCVNLNY